MYDVESVFKALCEHISYSTNGGNIKPCITIFPQRNIGQKTDPIRIWNKVKIGSC